MEWGSTLSTLPRDLIVMFLRFQMDQADFEHVVNSEQDFFEINWFTDKILRPGSQRAQLVIWLGGNHEDRQIPACFNFLQVVHDLETVHAGHLEIEQDQVVAV